MLKGGVVVERKRGGGGRRKERSVARRGRALSSLRIIRLVASDRRQSDGEFGGLAI